jgi:hypothetical protein
VSPTEMDELPDEIFEAMVRHIQTEAAAILRTRG